MKGVFYFDSQPPLGKQLIAVIAYFFDYRGDASFNSIGAGNLISTYISRQILIAFINCLL